MLINDGRILKNGDNVFMAQVVDSYIQFNSPQYNHVSFTLTGMSLSNPLNFYYVAPASTQKYSYDWDGYYTPAFQATGEGSYKKFYFSGNLDGVTTIEFYNGFIYNNYLYVGDLLKFINQFPNLKSIYLNSPNNNYYSYTSFNENISNTVFPKNIDLFHIADSTLSGDINTITNFNNVSDLELANTQLSGNLGTGFMNLTKLNLSYTYLNGSLNDIFANSQNLWYLNLAACYAISGDATTLDVSKLKYVNCDVSASYDVVGDVSGWTFNTGLTSFNLYSSQYLTGDVSNWDISNTNLTTFMLYGTTNNFPNDSSFSGNLSGWTLPSTIQTFQLYFSTGITSIPTNYSGLTYLSSFTMYALNNLNMSINDFVFNEKLQAINFYNYYGKSKLYGNLSTFIIPLSATSLSIINTYVMGNIELMSLTSKLQYLELNSNFLSGDVTGITIPDSLYALFLNNNSGVTFTLSATPYYSGKTAGVFHTKSTNQINLVDIGGISGDLSNLIIDGQLSSIYLGGNDNFYCDLSKLDETKINDIDVSYCTNVYGDLSNWFTGSSVHSNINLSFSLNLSGSTTDWNVNDVNYLRINNTNLSGQLKMSNPYQIFAADSKISSNIATDFNFSNRTYMADFNNCQYLIGNLSGVTLCNNQYSFSVYGCTGVTGSNSFIDYLFVNRKNFMGYSLNINIQNIGDTVSGGIMNIGDTGTFLLGTGSTGQWNLTESEVNFLVEGLDYTGIGISIPWTQAQKIYWMTFACISSINNNQRYTYYTIYY